MAESNHARGSAAALAQGPPAAAVLAAACLVSGLSYPGYPVDTAACAVVAALVAVTVAAARTVVPPAARHDRVRAVVVLALVVSVLVGAVVVAQADDGHRLRARWAASRPAFEHEVATAGDPVRLEGTAEPGPFARYPGTCPPRIGELSIVECRAVDGGFVFLQAQGALTDDSGIVFLPDSARPTSTWWSSETMTPLGGPWWSWTCHC